MVPATFDITSLLTTTATSLTGDIQSAAGVALPVAAGILGLTVVWRVFRKFVKG